MIGFSVVKLLKHHSKLSDIFNNYAAVILRIEPVIKNVSQYAYKSWVNIFSILYHNRKLPLEASRISNSDGCH